MASLRKRPAPEAAVAIDTDPAPSPATAPQPSALREQLQALRNSESLAQQAQQQAAAIEAVNRRCQEWVNQNELAQRHLGQLNDFHRNAIDSGYLTGTEDYFGCLRGQLEALENRPVEMVQEMKMRAPQDRQPERPQPVPRPIVSAPPSRDPSYGSSPTSIRLTREQTEFARLSGLTTEEYGRELLRLNQMKRDGHYSEKR
jgi:hypothetical protein